MRFIFFSGLALLLASCNFSEQDYWYNPLPQLAVGINANWSYYPDSFNVQLLYSPIYRDEDGQPYLDTTYYWGAKRGEYFYPASTVKMPVAALALQRLGEINLPGVDADAQLIHGAGREPQTAADQDSTSENGLPSVRHYVRKIFLVSDNDAYNRLYEFLGQDYINSEMRQRGLDSSRIIHRLSVGGFDTLGNRWLNPVLFSKEDALTYELPERYSKFYDDLGLRNQVRGKGYYDSELDTVVYEPFDFRYKNYYSLADLHGTVGRLVIPEAYPEEERFDLQPADYELIWEAMAQRPQESDYPQYDYDDNYVKFWLFGDRDSTTTTDIPSNIRILNKVGWAYGYLTDAAYIVDLETGTEFLLTGAIHVNENQIYNDGQYEYESGGLPFFGELGRAVYQYQLGIDERLKLPADDPLIYLLRQL
ncbi:MAG: serine hydrolase [Bacteroidota bacterium]